MTPIKSLLILTLLLASTLGLTTTDANAKAVEGVVNVNTATVQELTLLPGVGKSKAEQIVQLRQGKAFSNVDELKAVKGFGAKRLDALRPHLSFTGPTTAKAVKATQKPSVQPAGSVSSVPGKI